MSQQAQAVTEEVSRDRWEQFLNDFSEFNADMPVRVERVGAPDTGAGVVADQQPLSGEAQCPLRVEGRHYADGRNGWKADI